MTKALKEAKVNTSWIQPNESWDTATRDFVARILAPGAKNKFVPAFVALAEEIARLGAINSLAQTLIKCTAPGVPDIYQGNETWDFSLVDPDNRRPVDYERRRQMLAEIKNVAPDTLLRTWPDGRIKLFLTHRLLHFRRDHPELFREGSYAPLLAKGKHAESCLAFAREHAGRWTIVLAPRLTARVGFPPVGECWGDTAIELPEAAANGHAKDLFTGHALRTEGGMLKLSDAMSVLPFAVYANEHSG